MTGHLDLYTESPGVAVSLVHDDAPTVYTATTGDTPDPLNGKYHAVLGPFDLPNGHGCALTVQGLTYHGVLWLDRLNPVNQSASLDIDIFPFKPRRPAQVPQPALIFPPCGSCPNPTSYDKTLPMAPQDSRDYLRADCWGVTLPGLPFVPGGSSEHPERVLSWFLPFYPEPWPDRILTAHAERGYTHFYLSWPDFRARGGTLDQFVAWCLRAKSWGFWVHVQLWSKAFDLGNQKLAWFQATLDPVCDALFAANAVDEGGWWEYDANNTTQDAVAIHRYFGDRFHGAGASFWCHFLPEHGFWGTGGYSDWWNALGTSVDGLDYQGNPNFDIGQQQARLVDHLNEPVWANHKLRAFELYGAKMFSGDHPDEAECRALAYLTVCTKAKTCTWGSGSGFNGGLT